MIDIPTVSETRDALKKFLFDTYTVSGAESTLDDNVHLLSQTAVVIHGRAGGNAAPAEDRVPGVRTDRPRGSIQGFTTPPSWYLYLRDSL